MTEQPSSSLVASHGPVPSETARDSQAYYDQDEAFALNLERYWIEALALRYWVGGIVALCLLVGLVVTLLTTPQFGATARIEVSQVAANVTDIDPLEAEASVSELQYLNTQYELLRSRFMAGRVIEAGNLLRDEQFLDAFSLEDPEGLDRQSVGGLLLDKIEIQPIAQSSLVDVQFVSPSPEVSARIANLWVNEYIAANYEKRFGTNIEARDFLRNQIEELRANLSRSEQELISYANQNEILILNSASPDGGESSATQTLIAADLEALNAALAQAVTDRIAAESALVSGDVSSDGRDSRLTSELALAEAQLSTMKENFGPDYPLIKQKQSQVESLRASLRAKSTSELESARLRERQLRAQLEQAKSEFLGQQNQGIQYGILRREVETNRALYDALLQRFKELEATGAGQNNIKLIDEATVPDGPISPSLFLNLLLALGIAVLLAAGLVYLRVAMSQTVRDTREVKERFGLPLLGAIPKFRSEERLEELRQRSSQTSEAYRSLRSNVAFLTPKGEPRSILFTSTVPAEGKSFSATALAASFAQLGKRTLLIDADLRNSALAATLGIDTTGRGGLSRLLTAPDSALQDEAIAVSGFGFDYVPSGPRPPNPVDLLATPRLRQLVEQAQETYDQVVIDGAPLLSLADAVETARAAEGVIFVIESDRVKAKAIESAIERLKQSGAIVFGVLLTKLDERTAGYGYGYGYG
ncbi:MAG: polysaccharide biosynthesis tyrosine autokinase, partial [Erythrobacter sp.]